MERRALPARREHDPVLREVDGPEVKIDQTVSIDQDFQLTGFENTRLQVFYKPISQVRSDTDLGVRREDGEIAGATITVDQATEISQFSQIRIMAREIRGETFIRVMVIQKTKVKQDTDVDVLYTTTAGFNLDVDQTVSLDQKVQVKVSGDLGGLDLDVLFSQTAAVTQDADVAISGSLDDFDVAISTVQDAVLDQQASIGLSPAGDLWLA